MQGTAHAVRARVFGWSSASLHSPWNLQTSTFVVLVQLKQFIQSFAARFGDRLMRRLSTDNFRRQDEGNDDEALSS